MTTHPSSPALTVQQSIISTIFFLTTSTKKNIISLSKVGLSGRISRYGLERVTESHRRLVDSRVGIQIHCLQAGSSERPGLPQPEAVGKYSWRIKHTPAPAKDVWPVKAPRNVLTDLKATKRATPSHYSSLRRALEGSADQEVKRLVAEGRSTRV